MTGMDVDGSPLNVVKLKESTMPEEHTELNPWATVTSIATIALAAIVIAAILTPTKVDTNMQICVEAGGSFIDTTQGDHCLMGATQ